MKITEYMKEHLLYLDGGMGTLLQAAGLAPGELPERWCLSHPDKIMAIHRAYYDAGSHVVNTNTFGANSLKFSDEELDDIIGAAVACARRAAAESTAPGEKWVALDVGPTGRMLRPYGDLDFEDAVGIFAKTVRLGVKHGVDLIFIETMNDSYETKAALLAAKENSTLPVFVSNAYGEDGKLMTGADPAAMVAMLEGLGADAVGVNCSLGPKALSFVVDEYLCRASVPVLVKPNAGLPRSDGGRTVYDVGADEFAKDVAVMLGRGVRAAGGCCGTTPEYIGALVAQSAGTAPVPILQKDITCVSSYTHAVDLGKEPILIGERINPTGKKRFKEALLAHDIDYILREAIAEEECGVQLLDVNVGLPEIDEVALLTEAVCRLQAVTDLPLQIDSSDPAAIESALRRYNGKPMINSVSGKRESMDAILPLAAKYGGLVVALTLDEEGIPDTAEGRVAIAERILAEARKYGLGQKDLIVDPLALTVSADPTAAATTLRAVGMLRERGFLTSLGVSNVSFGLPERDAVNATFFAMALERGLSAAIMNPHSVEMMRCYHSHRALSGLDPACRDYIAFAATHPLTAATAPAAAPTGKKAVGSDLRAAIVHGLSERAEALARELLEKGKAAMEIIAGEIVPALDAVGEGFESKTVYLPQLLMSAEAAGAAFEVIKASMPGERTAEKGPLVLATVRGDIHDIGKNIVRLLLENYGFAVIDLGRDVPPERIVAETVRLHAPIVGLSALMTTTVPAMEETIRALRASAPWCHIMVGGAVLTEEYAAAIGADGYARDAMEAVRLASSLA